MILKAQAIPNLHRFAQTQVLEAKAEDIGNSSRKISKRQRKADREYWQSKRLTTKYAPSLFFAKLRVTQIATGYYHTLLQDDALNVYSFGSGEDGQLGLGSCQSFHEPQLIPDLCPAKLDGSHIVQLAGGLKFSVAVSSTGHVWTWGTGKHGELGLGTEKHRALHPQLVQVDRTADLGAVSVACGAHHTLLSCVGSSGVPILVWGRNNVGQLGLGKSKEDQFIPHSLNVHMNYWRAQVKQISAGQHHSAVLTVAGDLWTWGRNKHGQLCLRGEKVASVCYTPQYVEHLEKFEMEQVECGWQHTSILSSQGEIRVFGGEVYEREKRGHLTTQGRGWEASSDALLNGVDIACIRDRGAFLNIITTCGRLFTVQCEDEVKKSSNTDPIFAEPEDLPYYRDAGNDNDVSTEGTAIATRPLLRVVQEKQTIQDASYLDHLVDDMLLEANNDGVDKCKRVRESWDVSKLVSAPELPHLVDALGQTICTNMYAGRTPFYLPNSLPERALSPGGVARETRGYADKFEAQYGAAKAPKIERRPTVSKSVKSTAFQFQMSEREKALRRAERKAQEWEDVLYEHGWSRETKFGNYIPMNLLYDIQAYGRRLEDDNIMLEFRRVFYKFDKDRSEEINAYEMRVAMRSLGCRASLGTAQKIVQKYDADGTGTLEEEEFLDFCFDELVRARERGWLDVLFRRRPIVSKQEAPPTIPPQRPPAVLRREECEDELYKKFKRKIRAKPRVYADTFARFVKCFMRECVELDIWGELPEKLKRQVTVPSAQPLYHIGEIDLSDCEMTDAELKALCKALKCCPVIRRLDLRHNKITSVGAAAVADLLKTHDHLAEYVDCGQCLLCGKLIALDDPRNPRTPGLPCSCSPASRGGRKYYLPIYWLEHVVIEDPLGFEQRLASHKLRLALELDSWSVKLFKLERTFASFLPPTCHIPELDAIHYIESKKKFREDEFCQWVRDRVQAAADEFFEVCNNDLSKDIQIREIRRVFLEADKDDSGYLDVKELKKCLRTLGLNKATSKEQMNAMFQELDKDGNGFVTMDEFEQYVEKLLEDNSNLKLLGRKRKPAKLDENGLPITKKKGSKKARYSTIPLLFNGRKRKEEEKRAKARQEKILSLVGDLKAFGMMLYETYHKPQYRDHAHHVLRKMTVKMKKRMYEEVRDFFHATCPLAQVSEITRLIERSGELYSAKLQKGYKWTAQDHVWGECKAGLKSFGEILQSFYADLNDQVRVTDVVSGLRHSVLLTARGLPWVKGFQDSGLGPAEEVWKHRMLDGIKSIEKVSSNAAPENMFEDL